MKILTWNCGGALRKKTTYIDAINADILVIQECEDPAHSTNPYKKWAGDYLWAGEKKDKGIGVFAQNGHAIQKLVWDDVYVFPGGRNGSSALIWKSCDLLCYLVILFRIYLHIHAMIFHLN